MLEADRATRGSSGEAPAISEVVATYLPMVRRFLLFLTQDAESSEELAQETARVALEKGPDPTKGTNFGAWLRSIARNLAQNDRRRTQSRWLVFDTRILEAAERRFVAVHADDESAWAERRDALMHCMAKLSAEERILLHLRYARGESVKEIAAKGRLEPNTLSKRLQRIRERLRICIEARLLSSRSR